MKKRFASGCVKRTSLFRKAKTTFNLPNFTDRVPQGSGSRGTVCAYLAESLPNIKEYVPSSLRCDFGNPSVSGSVFEIGDTSGYQYTAGTGFGLTSGFDLNVSRKYPVYKDGAPVQQAATVVVFCIRY